MPLLRRFVRYYDLPQENGILVISVEQDSPAGRAGIRDGDILLSFGGEPVESLDELFRKMGEERIGQVSACEFLRGTEKLQVEITPEEAC